MKIKLRKLFSVALSTALISSNILYASASDIEVSYDLKNAEYIDFLSECENIGLKYEEQIVKHLNENFFKNKDHSTLVHIYYSPYKMLFEFDFNGTRRFSYGFIDCICYNETGTPMTEEKLSELLNENNIDYINASVYNNNIILNNPTLESYIELSDLILSNTDNYYLSVPLSLETLPMFSDVIGDSNIDGKLDVRDSADIAFCLATGNDIPINADFNGDGEVNVRDAAAVARKLAEI